MLRPAIEAMKEVKSEDGRMLTERFLHVCKLLLPVLEKFGSSLALVKTDVWCNLSRLESKYASDPCKFNLLYSVVLVEVEAKTARTSSSCTNGILWITRSFDFLVELLRVLLEHSGWSMSQACKHSYKKTLKKWHGWLTSSSFAVGMNLLPDRRRVMEVVGSPGDIVEFCSAVTPLLEENHKFLKSIDLDNMKAP